MEFATTLAPGLRDVLLTGKVKECVNRRDANGRPVYDAVVLDAPPTGRVVKFLDVTKAMADLARTGPIHSQAAGVVQVLHSPLTAVHLVTLLEANDEWQLQHRYMQVEAMAELMPPVIEGEPEPLPPPAQNSARAA